MPGPVTQAQMLFASITLLVHELQTVTPGLDLLRMALLFAHPYPEREALAWPQLAQLVTALITKVQLSPALQSKQ